MMLPTGGSNKQRSYFGFTLVEILLVVILLGIIAGLTIPNFSQSYSNLQFQNSVDDLAYSMRYAQSRAIALGVEHSLVFQDDFKGYQLTQESKKISGRLGRRMTIADDIEVDSTLESILFSPDGNMQKARIFLCRDEKCFTISTQDLLGHVIVLDYKLDS